MYQVIVGNIGTVHEGAGETEARAVFEEYKEQAGRSFGRAAGEPVTLMRDGEPIDEFRQLRVLSIDAWRGACGWDWNAWYHIGAVAAADLPEGNRAILRLMRDRGYLSAGSAGRVAIEDDGYSLVIVARGTREPLYAIEYGAGG